MSLDTLFEQLQHPNPHFRDRVMGEIASSGDPEAIPKLMLLLDADDVSLRRSAVRAMGAIGPKAIPVLSRRLADTDDPTIAASCCKGLAQIAVNWREFTFSEETMRLLGDKALEPNPVVQITAVMALGEMGEKALPMLEHALRGGDLAIALASLNALASMNHASGKVIVENFQNDAGVDIDPMLKEAMRAALDRFTGKPWKG